MNLPAPATSANPSYLRAFEILAQVARHRGRVYRWLALGFYPPDQTLVEALGSGQMQNELLDATAWLGGDQLKLLDSIQGLKACAGIHLERLAREYHDLFESGLASISLHETEYRWRDSFNLSAASDSLRRSLQQQYRRDGLAPVAGMEDHVAVELEFLAYQCESEAACWMSCEAKAGRELRRREWVFLDDDLGRWLPEFCQRIHEKGISPFYQTLSSLCDGWLGLDQGPGYLPMAAQA